MNLKSAHTTSSALAYSEVGFLHICLIIFRETAVNLTQQCANINWNTNKAKIDISNLLHDDHCKQLQNTVQEVLQYQNCQSQTKTAFYFFLIYAWVCHGNWNCLYYPKLNSYKLGKFQNYSEFQHFSSEDRPPMLTLLRATKHL